MYYLLRSNRRCRNKRFRFSPAIALLVLFLVLPVSTVVAADMRIDIQPAHKVFFVGETVSVRISITASTTAPFPYIRFDRIYRYPGAFNTELLDPDGKPLLGGPPAISPPTGVQANDRASIPAGEIAEGEVSVLRRPVIAGPHNLRVIYRPNWSDEQRRYDLPISVVAINDVDVKSKATAGDVSDPAIEVLHLKSGDEYWLIHHNLDTHCVTRITKTTEKATFKLSTKKTAEAPIKELIISIVDGSEQRTLRVDHASGSLLE